MRSKAIFAMGVLNVLLLASLCFRHVFTQPAQGQIKPALGKASEYLMISGEVQGVPGGVIFILDTRNQMLTVRKIDAAANKLQDLPPTDLTRFFKGK